MELKPSASNVIEAARPQERQVAELSDSL